MLITVVICLNLVCQIHTQQGMLNLNCTDQTPEMITRIWRSMYKSPWTIDVQCEEVFPPLPRPKPFKSK